MRAARLISAVVAFGLLGLVPATSPPAAAGAAAGAGQTAVVPQAGDEEVTITSRVVNRKVPGKPKRRLYLVGRVEPAQGPVFIQMAKRCNKEPFRCNFKFYRKRYLKDGKYIVPITASPTHRSFMWQAKIGEATSPIWRTCVEEPCRLPFPREND